MPIVKKSTTRAKRPSSKVSLDQQKHPLQKWVAAVGISLFVIIGVPLAIWAQVGSAGATGQVTVNSVALESLRSHLGEAVKALDMLMTAPADQGSQSAPAATAVSYRLDEGRAACLDGCGIKLGACREQGASGNADQNGMDSCLTQANSCINACSNMPRPPVACEDRCATSLDGCLRSVVIPQATVAADESSTLNRCLQDNRSCLVKACKLDDQNQIPSNACYNQCSRVREICLAASAGNTEQCGLLYSTCNERVCSQTAVSTSDTAPFKPEDIIACTDSDLATCSAAYAACIKQGIASATCAAAKNSCQNNCARDLVSGGACLDNQQSVCGKINDMCKSLKLDDSECTSMQASCASSCNKCSANKLAVCYATYSACTDGDCFSGISSCLDQCQNVTAPITSAPAPEDAALEPTDLISCQNQCQTAWDACKTSDAQPYTCKENLDACGKMCGEKFAK